MNSKVKAGKGEQRFDFTASPEEMQKFIDKLRAQQAQPQQHSLTQADAGTSTTYQAATSRPKPLNQYSKNLFKIFFYVILRHEKSISKRH